MFKRILTWVSVLALAASPAVMTGCSTVTADQIRANPTPELHSTSRSFGQWRNDHAITNDNNLRGFWDDLDRVLLTDQTRTGTPYPAP